MNEITKFFGTTYPKIWNLAWELGVTAKKTCLPRTCNLTDDIFHSNGIVIRSYKLAWEFGWDHLKK